MTNRIGCDNIKQTDKYAKEKANMNIAYVRVSTKDQNPERQINTMRELGVEDRFIFVEKESGKDFNRPVYQAMKLTLREGDLLYIDSIDRLGRNYDQDIEEWKELTKKIKVDVVALDKQDIFDSRKFKAQGDTGKLLEDMMLSLFSWMAEQERKKGKERQAEGIANAKAKGIYKGRKPIDINKEAFEAIFKEVESGDRTNKYAMKKLGLKPNTYYKAVADYKAKTGKWAN